MARAVKQLARKYIKLAAKELKGNQKATPVTRAHAVPKPAIHTTRTAAKRPVAAKVTVAN